MKTCPNCYHKPSKEELNFYPEYCSQCGTLYSALEVINEKKRQDNENLKAWRVTRWRAKNGRGLIFGVPAFIIILYVVYQIGHLVIANSQSISNLLYQLKNHNALITSKTGYNNSIKESSLANISSNENYEALLTVTSKKTVTLWLIHEETNKKIGPILVSRNSPEKIYLEKGRYIGRIIDNGKMTLKSIFVDKKVNQTDL